MIRAVQVVLAVLGPIVQAVIGGLLNFWAAQADRPDSAAWSPSDPGKAELYRRVLRERIKNHCSRAVAPLILCLGLFAGGCGQTHRDLILVGPGDYAYLAEDTPAKLLVPTGSASGGLEQRNGTIPAGWIVMAPPSVEELTGQGTD